MKKSFRLFCLFMTALIAAAILVGCSVSGNTYTFDSIKTEGVSESTESAEFYESLFKRDLTFSDNGSYTVGGNAAGYYKMSGGNIYVSTTGGDIDTSGAPQYVLSGDKLILKKTFDDGVSVTVTFKKI